MRSQFYACKYVVLPCTVGQVHSEKPDLQVTTGLVDSSGAVSHCESNPEVACNDDIPIIRPTIIVDPHRLRMTDNKLRLLVGLQTVLE